MKACICGLYKNKRVDKSDVVFGIIAYPLVLAIFAYAFGAKPALIGGVILLSAVGIVTISNASGGHSTKCAFRAAVIKVLGFAGFISPF